jgi:hypothetical protein
LHWFKTSQERSTRLPQVYLAYGEEGSYSPQPNDVGRNVFTRTSFHRTRKPSVVTHMETLWNLFLHERSVRGDIDGERELT